MTCSPARESPPPHMYIARVFHSQATLSVHWHMHAHLVHTQPPSPSCSYRTPIGHSCIHHTLQCSPFHGHRHITYAYTLIAKPWVWHDLYPLAFCWMDGVERPGQRLLESRINACDFRIGTSLYPGVLGRLWQATSLQRQQHRHRPAGASG